MKGWRVWDEGRGCYVIKNLDWIKEQIIKKYCSHLAPTHEDYISNMGRKMFIHIDKNSYKPLGYVFFSVSGSPPKGCAIYQPDHRFIIIIDAWGKSKKYNQTIIDEDLLKGEG